MRKEISLILCICFLTVAVSGCGSEESGLTEDSNTATFVESSEPEKADAEGSNTEQESTELKETEQQQAEQTEAAEATTPVQIQEIAVSKEAYLLTEVPELWDIAHCIHQKTGGQASFRVDMIWEPDYQAIYHGRELPGYYDFFYAGVVWPDHEENGIWFYVGQYEGQILCREDDEEELHTLEEWRAGGKYAARMDAVFEWQQEKANMLLASEGESLDEPWYEAYKSIIMDWTIIEDFEDRGYVGDLKDAYAYHSSDFCYEFYSYWLCDMDRNGTPELFLWYPSGRRLGDIMVILTYTDHPIVFGGTPVFMEQIYGINAETGEVIIAGHWTGAGGTNEYEWSGYRIQGDTLEFCFYIDSWAEFEEYAGDTPYRVDYPERYGGELQADGREYEEIYENHVANCIPVENFVMYDMMDLSGLKDIQ